MLLSDPAYILPDDGSMDPAKLRLRITNVYTSITKIKDMLENTSSEDMPATLQFYQENFPGFNKNLIPGALAKLEARLAVASGGKSRKINKKKNKKSKSRRR